MITVTPVRSPDYYLEQVSRDRHDYLTGEGEAPGRWEGTWASILGVNGEVTGEAFRAMFEGLNPVTGNPLKKYENRKVAGWDLTFSVPKSISALWAIAPDHVAEQIREADRIARRLGLAVFECYACVARLAHNGVDRQPGLGFLVAVFEHQLSRDGDPQLHDHQVVANAVEAADGRTAALDGTMLYRWQKAADAVYQAALRAELTARLGLTWVQRNGVWEIDGIPPALCRLWSKRRAAIEAELAEHGTSGGRAAHAAALATRKPKVTEDLQDLRQRLLDEACNARFDLDAILSFTLDRARHRHDGRGLTGLSDKDIIDSLVGPEGLTQKASGFGRRDVIAGIGALLIADSPDGQTAADRIDHIADTFFADPRVIPLADPVRKTSGEVIRPRDEHGRVMREVCLEEPRFTTASLLAAETELITRAKHRQDSGAAVVPDHVVARVIGEYNAAHPGRELDADQVAMVWQLCTSGNAVDVVVGKAGTGKSTALEVARRCFEAAGISVIGVAPTANAARQLEKASGIPACTLDKLLVEVTNGVGELPHGVAVVHDEAGMTATRNRLALQQLIDAVGGKVADVGDHRQIPSVDAGGGHAVLARELGAVTLGIGHRFKLPTLRDAAELIRDGHANAAIALLYELGMVYEYCQPDQRTDAMVDHWLSLRDQPEHNDVRMLATENSLVERLNLAARAALIARGEVSRRGRTYTCDTRDLRLSVGDRVRLGRNDGHLPQPDGTHVQVRNGMEGTVVATTRYYISVQLDPGEDLDQVTLPAAYVAEHVDYAYALTANKAQGLTVDHILFAPSPATSRETAYTALSRGRYSNHIYAVTGSGWEEALGNSRAHAFASDQHPIPDRGRRPVLDRRNTTEREDLRARLLFGHENRTRANDAQGGANPEQRRARREREQHDHDRRAREGRDGRPMGM